LKVPDTEAYRSWLGRILHKTGFAGYPTLRLMGLVETGTRGLLGAALGSARHRGGGEVTLARRLLGCLGPGMLVPADRAFDTNAFLHEAAATGAHRSPASRPPCAHGDTRPHADADVVAVAATFKKIAPHWQQRPWPHEPYQWPTRPGQRTPFVFRFSMAHGSTMRVVSAQVPPRTPRRCTPATNDVPVSERA
jgi:hypothetical protein